MSMHASQKVAVELIKAAWSKPLTENEKRWIEMIRAISHDSDPTPTLVRVQGLRNVLL